MVVIAIIGLIAAIAVPAYSQYQVRAQFAAIIKLMEPTIASMKDYIDIHGTSPPNISVGSSIIPLYSNASNISGFPSYISWVQYGYQGATGSPGGLISIYVNIPQAGSVNGQYDINLGVRYVNGNIYTACGQFSTGNAFPGMAGYFPATCQCQGVQPWAERGIAGTGCPPVS